MWPLQNYLCKPLSLSLSCSFYIMIRVLSSYYSYTSPKFQMTAAIVLDLLFYFISHSIYCNGLCIANYFTLTLSYFVSMCFVRVIRCLYGVSALLALAAVFPLHKMFHSDFDVFLHFHISFLFSMRRDSCTINLNFQQPNNNLYVVCGWQVGSYNKIIVLHLHFILSIAHT